MHSITLHACISEPTTKIWMQIDPYCQRRKCSPLNVVSSDIRVMQIFVGVRQIWGIKQESGRLRFQFSYLSLAIFSKSSSPRLKLLYSNTYFVIGILFTWKWVTLDDLELLYFEFSLFVNEWAWRWERVHWPEDQRDCWLAAVLWISPRAHPAVGEVIRRGSGDMGRQTRKWSYKHDKPTQCCHAFTLALARLSCYATIYCITLCVIVFTTICLIMC